jgi:hypothetical protein
MKIISAKGAPDTKRDKIDGPSWNRKAIDASLDRPAVPDAASMRAPEQRNCQRATATSPVTPAAALSGVPVVTSQRADELAFYSEILGRLV